MDFPHLTIFLIPLITVLDYLSLTVHNSWKKSEVWKSSSELLSLENKCIIVLLKIPWKLFKCSLNPKLYTTKSLEFPDLVRMLTIFSLIYNPHTFTYTVLQDFKHISASIIQVIRMTQLGFSSKAVPKEIEWIICFKHSNYCLVNVLCNLQHKHNAREWDR